MSLWFAALFIMIKKIVQILKSCFSFWKDLLFSKDKKRFIHENLTVMKSQTITLFVSLLGIFVFYTLCGFVFNNAIKPAVKAVCRYILQSDEEGAVEASSKIIGIEAKKISTGTTLRQVKATGVLKANAEVVLKSEIPGKITEILFAEGSEVEAGQDLIVFEDDEYKSSKERYEAEYVLCKGEFERNKRLYDQRAGAQKTYEESLAKMNEAKAQFDSAKFQLSKTRIKAPFKGVVGIMKISPGNIVQQHTELVNVVDNSFVRVEFSVPVKYVEELAHGQTVEITIDAFKDRVFSGTVDAIDPEVDTKNHCILVRAVIPNKNGSLKHGMFAHVKLITGEKSDVVLVDEDALDREGNIQFVWVVDEKGRAGRRRIIAGAKDVSGVEVLDGLKEGETVVLSGQMKLSEGSKVKILNTDYDNGKPHKGFEAEDKEMSDSDEPKRTSAKNNDGDIDATEKEDSENKIEDLSGEKNTDSESVSKEGSKEPEKLDQDVVSNNDSAEKSDFAESEKAISTDEEEAPNDVDTEAAPVSNGEEAKDSDNSSSEKEDFSEEESAKVEDKEKNNETEDALAGLMGDIQKSAGSDR